MVSQQKLQELFYYSAETGVFTHRSSGQPAGHVDYHGYRRIKIDGRGYMAHRLAWLYVTGQWPLNQIDHKDRQRDNNAFNNLRPATNKQNHENGNLRVDNVSGVVGVCLRPNGKWEAGIWHNGRRRYLGVFSSLSEATTARRQAEVVLFTHSPDDR